METQEGPPAPDDPEWDAWAEEKLADVEFDTQLGKEMARDALRLGDGDLTKAEFHDKYGDAVEAEFGVDERPTKSAYEDREEPIPKVPNQHEETRRNVLRALGGVAAVGTASLAGCVGDPSSTVPSHELEGNDTGNESEDGDGLTDESPAQKRLGMVIDTSECIACLQCSKACKEENNTDTGVHWPYVFRYQDQHAGDTREGYLTRHCQHCSEPSCTYVCPTQARYQREDDGLVLTDYDTCVGCKYCQVACPYGVNYLGKDESNEMVGNEFGTSGIQIDEEEVDEDGINLDSDGVELDSEQIELDSDREVRFDTQTKNGVEAAGTPPKGVMGKCTFCVHRQDSNHEAVQGTTACGERCPEDVIQFGDLNNPESDPRQRLREKRDSNQYKLLEEVGNEPNIIYIGQKPSKDAEPVQGPVAYEDHDMKDGNYGYVIGADEDDGGEQT